MIHKSLFITQYKEFLRFIVFSEKLFIEMKGKYIQWKLKVQGKHWAS